MTIERSMTSHHHGSKISGSRWPLRQQQEWQKSYSFRLVKQQLLLFGTFLGRRCTTATWNFLIAHAHFMEYMNETLTFSSLIFLYLHTVLSGSFPENFASIWKIKRNWIRAMKFETMQIQFHPEILLPWQNDFSSQVVYTGKNTLSYSSKSLSSSAGSSLSSCAQEKKYILIYNHSIK